MDTGRAFSPGLLWKTQRGNAQLSCLRYGVVSTFLRCFERPKRSPEFLQLYLKLQ